MRGDAPRRLALAGGAAAAAAAAFANEARPPRISHSQNQETRELLARCKVLRGIYWPSPCCLNQHAAIFTVWWHDQKQKFAPRVDFRRETLVHPDGGVTGGFKLHRVATLRSMGIATHALTHNSTLVSALDWAEGLRGPELEPTTPLVVFLHSICADSDDDFGLVTWLRNARLSGFRPVVHVRRGHGGLALATPRFSALGDSRDTRDALVAVKARFPDAPVAAIGLSAGTGPLIGYLGELSGPEAPELIAGVAVSAGFTIPVAFDRCSALYQPILLEKGKGMFVRSPSAEQATWSLGALVPRVRTDADLALLARHDSAALDGMINAKTMHEFHDYSRAFAGHGDKTSADHDRRHNPLHGAHRCRTPLLCISADDDPLCVRANVEEAKSSGLIGPAMRTIVAETRRGSHLAFFEGLGARSRWAERAAFEFLHAALACKRDVEARLPS
jgi:predicted alpha/beta-fold hydrolase